MTIEEYRESIKKNKASKYKNKKTECLLHHLHDSKFEASHCDKLLFLVRAKEIISYEIQKRFPLHVNHFFICNHIVDFLVHLEDDQMRVEETKGAKTKDWVIKKKLFEAIYPNIKYVVINKKN
jgi:hypothetical protein